ncbi:hypothetical protein [Mycolicibacterium sp. PDY-3]|uniref:hypothetical protein n=1 Tax=Mycolicibacterium sp. PDY-3 TaxID=3376069 RepID=UPI0037961DC2
MDLVDLAERAAAAADLDDQARGHMDAELEFGTDKIAIIEAVLETRTPPPPDVLDHSARWVDAWDVQPEETYRQLVMGAVHRQQRQQQESRPWRRVRSQMHLSGRSSRP